MILIIQYNKENHYYASSPFHLPIIECSTLMTDTKKGMDREHLIEGSELLHLGPKT